MPQCRKQPSHLLFLLFSGMMCDSFKSYKSVFYLAGASMIFGSIILLLVPCFTPPNIQQMANLTLTTPNGTRIKHPDIIVTDVNSNSQLLVVEKLTVLQIRIWVSCSVNIDVDSRVCYLWSWYVCSLRDTLTSYGRPVVYSDCYRSLRS